MQAVENRAAQHFSLAAHALKHSKYSHLLWDSSGIRQARADMWNLCHLLNCSVTMNWAALPALACRNEWRGLGWHMLTEWGARLSLCVAGWQSLEGSTGLCSGLFVSAEDLSNCSLKADAPTQSEAWEPLGSAVPSCFETSWSGSEGAWMMPEMTGWLDKGSPESRAAKLSN